jgi:hypothetical protein
MQAGARCTIVGLLAVMLGSCARLAEPTDRAHELSRITDTITADDARCQSSGASLGSPAYKQCRALLEDKMTIERDVPPTLGYAPNPRRKLGQAQRHCAGSWPTSRSCRSY